MCGSYLNSNSNKMHNHTLETISKIYSWVLDDIIVKFFRCDNGMVVM